MPLARIVMYAATAGAIALSAWTLAVEPPPPWVAFGGLGIYLLLLVLGVVFSHWSMFADVVTEGPEGGAGVALTFDDGPDPETTPQVLDALDAAGAQATFFVIGEKAERHPELIRNIAARGHTVGIHSYHHSYWLTLRSPWFVKRELERCLAVLRPLLDEPPRLFRAPIGHVSPAMGREAKELGLYVIGWTIKGRDGLARTKAEEVVKRISPHLRDGAIVLLHDAAERGDFVPASLPALTSVIAAAKARQLDLVSLDHWLAAGDREPIP
ncbi:MAG: polysaccharide deacetylase family protein [Myxococcota bacterium]